MGSDDLYYFSKRKRLKRNRKKVKEYRNSMLIVCEGTETEVNYFKAFPVANIKVQAIGVAKSNISLVEDAIKKWKEHAEKEEYFERLWCVFDRDDFPLKNYNRAFESIVIQENRLNKRYRKKVGREVKIDIAYSNQAFELWYLLHFDYIDTGLERFQYKNMLSQRMKREYRKNDQNMYDLLSQSQKLAIKNAKKLEKNINKKLNHNHNPSTTVYKLVEELNTHLKK